MSRESSDGEDSVVGAGTDRFVDVTAETELRLPLEVDMEPNRDVPTYPGVANLGVVGPEVDTKRRFEPPTWAKSQRRMSGKLVDDRCAFGAPNQTYPGQHLPKIGLPPGKSTPGQFNFGLRC